MDAHEGSTAPCASLLCCQCHWAPCSQSRGGAARRTPVDIRVAPPILLLFVLVSLTSQCIREPACLFPSPIPWGPSEQPPVAVSQVSSQVGNQCLALSGYSMSCQVIHQIGIDTYYGTSSVLGAYRIQRADSDMSALTSLPVMVNQPLCGSQYR